MAKKEMTPSHTTIKTQGDNSSIHYHIGDTNPIPKKEKESNWIVKAIICGIITLVLSLLGYYIKNNMNSNKIHTNVSVSDDKTQPDTKH